MKIENLKINNFGKIEDKQINFGENINIIQGKNESGKSTLQKFIIGMFYGLSKNKNGKFKSDFERYYPWEKEEFSGKLTYKLDNNEKYEVFRDFKKKNPKIFNSQMEDISNTFNIDKQNGNQFFIDQTKVDETLFASTILIEQQEVQLDEKNQLSLVQKMTNLVGTGDDNISFNKIISKLNKKQLEEIGTQRSQDRPINILIKQLEKLEEEQKVLENYKDKKYEMQENIIKIEQDIEDKEEEIKLLNKIQEIKNIDKIEQEKLNATKTVEQNYSKKIEELKNELNNKQKDIAKEINTEKVNPIYIILSSILLVIAVIILAVSKQKLVSILPIIFAVILIIIYSYKQNRNKKRLLSNKKQKNVEIAKVKNEIEILENTKQNCIEEIQKKKEELVNKTNLKLYELKNEFKTIKIEEIENIYKNNAELKIQIEQNKLNNLKVELHSLKADNKIILEKLEDLAKLKEEQNSLEEQYQFLNNLNETIEITKQEIEKAYQEMKENVTPKFTKDLSKIIEQISDGKYKKVKFDDEQGIIVEIENGDYISAKNLSVGTIDQLYLSLRLSASSEISKETLPIILDEAFAYYDNQRLENILKFLNSEYKDRQILIFTCTDREKEILQRNNINYNLIQM